MTERAVEAHIRVRGFTESDRTRLRAIFLRSRETAFHWLGDRRYALDDFDASTAGEEIWVAEVDGEVVGFASVWAAASFVHNLFIDPAHAGRGAGTALHGALVGAYAPPLRLKCLKANAPALSFYRGLGWRVEGDGQGPDGEYFDLVLAS